MGCNCATSEQLARLYEKYGEKKAEKPTSFKRKAKIAVQKIGVGACMVVITPILALYVFYKMFGSEDHKISIKRMFRIPEEKLQANGEQII